MRSTPRKPPKDRSETPVPRVKKRRVSAANVEKENQKLKSQVESLTRELNGKKALIEDLQQQLSKTQTELEKNAANNSQQLSAMKKALEGQTFRDRSKIRGGGGRAGAFLFWPTSFGDTLPIPGAEKMLTPQNSVHNLPHPSSSSRTKATCIVA